MGQEYFLGHQHRFNYGNYFRILQLLPELKLKRHWGWKHKKLLENTKAKGITINNWIKTKTNSRVRKQ